MNRGKRLDLFYAIVVIALCSRACLGAQLAPRSVTIGGKTADLNGKDVPLILGLKPDYGPLLDKYGVSLEFRNNGNEVTLKQADVAVYAGSFTNTVPKNATALEVDSTETNANLPTIKKGDVWPDGGLKFAIAESSIPASVGCEPFDMTLDVVTTYSLDGRQEKERDLIPLQVSPNCLSNNFPPRPPEAASNTSIVDNKVTIDFASKYIQTTSSTLGFVINFGSRVLEGNPLKLVNVTGTSRFDILYAWEKGEIYLVAYPEYDDKDATITVRVDAASTTYDSGVPNSASELTVQYKPGNGAYQQAAIVLTAVFAALILLSWFTSFLVSSVQPWATAGSLGYGALGFILWAQRFYLSGMISTEVMPANYKTMTDVFAWSNFQAPLPWNWGSQTYGLPSNLTEGNNLIFQEGSIVILNSRDLSYSDYTTNSSIVMPTTPSLVPSPAIEVPTTPEAQAPVAEPVPVPVVVPEEPQVPVAPPPEQPGQTPAADASALTPGQDSCSVFENTDFFGGDLDNGSPVAADPQECCNACLAEPNCIVWTFSFVDNKCYLKGKSGWQMLGDRTCCVSGTANRNGVAPIPLDQLTAGGNNNNNDGGKNNSNNNDGGKNNNNNNNNNNNGGKNNSNNNNGGKNNNNNNNDKNNNDKNNNNKNNNGGKNNNNNNNLPLFGRKMLEGRRLQQSSTIDSIPVGPENIRFIAYSYNDPFSNATTQNVVVISGKNAGDRAQYLLETADASNSSDSVYDRLERAAFWFGCLLAVAVIVNGVSYMFVKCCEGEVPGVLYMPRMLLMVMLVSLTGFAFAGAVLFSGGGGLVPILVGILVVVFYPVLFLVASYIGLAAALYRKRKAVYLLSSRAPADDGDVNKWDQRVVSEWMGMSLNRGKWRPTDPSKKNEFVFRWGPLFEDCRGPLFQRKKVESNPSLTSRRVHSAASDHSSQSGANTISESGMVIRRSSSRKKVTSVEEKPMCKCCGSNWRRSNYQAYGTIMSFTRMCIYGLLIGALGDWPAAQAGSCLGVSVVYLCYLRFAVPLSRRDEMALEYWVAFMDIIVFGILLGLTVGVGSQDFSGMDTFCIVLIVFQAFGFLAYLINRVLIIVHAFAEVVCPACKCGAPSPKKSKRGRRSKSSLSRSESLTYSASEASGSQQMYNDGKPYYANGSSMNGKDMESLSGASDPSGYENGSYTPPKQAQNMTPESRMNSRSSRQGSFPVILEEPGVTSVPLSGNTEDAQEIDLSQGLGPQKGQNAVFDKFWRSL